MFHKQIVIIDNKEIAAGYFVMELISSQIAQNSFPGQFLHIKCSSDSQPLLRRPLSIHRVISENPIRNIMSRRNIGTISNGASTIEILYKVVGKGTYELSKRKKGEKIDCIGPLGNGFELPKDQRPKTKDQILIVAGGIGIAPLFFLAERITEIPISNYQFPIIVFLGAKTKDDILRAKELKKLGVKLYIATEDGSLGSKGVVGGLLKKHLSSVVPARQYLAGGCPLSSVVYACGPKAMLKEIALISKKHQIPCQVSFEQFMGCGIGICNACVIKTKQGYKRVCKDGPVFSAEEIDWKRI